MALRKEPGTTRKPTFAVIGAGCGGLAVAGNLAMALADRDVIMIVTTTSVWGSCRFRS